MTDQNDRQDESLTGQVRDQAEHCLLTGRYFQPCHSRLFIAMIENLTKSMSHMACFLFLNGWLKDSIFTRQHKMADELQLPLLIQKCTF